MPTIVQQPIAQRHTLDDETINLHLCLIFEIVNYNFVHDRISRLANENLLRIRLGDHLVHQSISLGKDSLLPSLGSHDITSKIQRKMQLKNTTQSKNGYDIG